MENPAITILVEQIKYIYGWYKEDKDNSSTKINKYDEVEHVLHKDDRISKRIDLFCKKINGNKVNSSGFHGNSNISLEYVSRIDPDCEETKPHYIAHVHGGLNGPGHWDKYLKDLARLILMMNDNIFDHAYVCEIDNDCADDVFTARIGFRLRKKEI